MDNNLLTPGQLAGYVKSQTPSPTSTPTGGLLSPAQLSSYASKMQPSNPTSTVGSSWDAFDKAIEASKPKSVTTSLSDFFKSSEPSFKASETGSVSDIPTNLAKMVGNVPSSARDITRAAIAPVNPFDTESPLNIGSNIVKSAGAAKDIYSQQGFLEGTKNILGGFADTYLKIGEKIYGGLDKAYNALLDDPKKAISDTTAHLARIGIEDPLLIPSLLYGGAAAGEKDLISSTANLVTRGADTSLENIASKAKGLVDTTVEKVSQAKSNIQEGLQTKLQDRYVSQAAGDWEDIANKTQTTSRRLYQSEKAGKDPTTYLAERGISPESLTEKIGGKRRYSTLKKADEIVADNIKLDNEVLQPVLKEAQRGMKPITFDEMEADALKLANSERNINLGEARFIKAEIKAAMDDYRETIGEATDLLRWNDIKQARWTKVYGEGTSKFVKDADYYIGKAIKERIEKAVPGAPIAEFNDFLGQGYDAARFLKSLNSKVAESTAIGDVAKKSMKWVGGAIGEATLGHPGAIAGYAAGENIGKLFAGMSNPLKAMVLRNIQKTNPEAYNSMIKYLGEQEAARMQRGLLPAPSGADTKINQGRPIPVAPSGETGVERVSGETQVGDYKRLQDAATADPTMSNTSKTNMNGKISQEGGFVNPSLVVGVAGGAPAVALGGVSIVATSTDKGGEIHKLSSGVEVRPATKYQKDIDKMYQAHPELPKGILESTLMQESSMGTNSSKKNDSIGKYAWLVGMSKTGKEELDRLGIKYNLNTPAGAIKAMADFYSAKMGVRGGDGKVSYTITEPDRLYRVRYNAGGTKLTKADIEKFKKYVDYYSSPK